MTVWYLRTCCREEAVSDIHETSQRLRTQIVSTVVLVVERQMYTNTHILTCTRLHDPLQRPGSVQQTHQDTGQVTNKRGAGGGRTQM